MNTSKIMMKLIRSVVFGYELSTSEVSELKALLTEETLSKLYDLSKFHDVAHLVGFAFKKYDLIGESHIAQKLYKMKFAAAFRCEKIIKELDALMGALEAAEIDHIALKGSVIRALYPQAWMRTSCDIDILVHEEDLDSAVEVICNKLGYNVEGKKAYHDISLYSPEGTHLELHFSIKENMDKIDTVLSLAWDNTVLCDGTKHTYRFTNEFLFCHVLAHASYHFVRGGCGVKSFIDIRLLSDKLEMRKDLLDDLLQKAGLLQFAESCRALCRVWFEDGDRGVLEEDMEKFVLSGGVYGTTTNAITVSRSKQGGRIRYLLSRLFVSSSQLSISYPILKKYKILMPFCQIARWFKLLRKDKRDALSNEIKINNDVSSEQIMQIKKMMIDLGLDES